MTEADCGRETANAIPPSEGLEQTAEAPQAELPAESPGGEVADSALGAAESKEPVEESPDAASAPPEAPDEEIAPTEEAEAIEEPEAEPEEAEPAPCLGDVLGAIARMEHLFQEKIRYDDSREQIIDRLHEELQEYKQNLQLKILRKLVMDIIGLHDDIGKTARAYREKLAGGAAVTPEKLIGVIEDFQIDIEDILERHSVEAYEAEGDRFDPQRQRVLKPVACEDPDRHGQIAVRLRKGFRYEDKVLRPELVSVYRADGNSK